MSIEETALAAGSAWPKPGLYWILNTVARRGAHLTEAWEVKAAPIAGSPYSVRAIPFRLTPAAIDADSRKLHTFMRTWVYGVRPLPELAKQGAGSQGSTMHQEGRVPAAEANERKETL